MARSSAARVPSGRVVKLASFRPAARQKALAPRPARPCGHSRSLQTVPDRPPRDGLRACVVIEDDGIRRLRLVPACLEADDCGFVGGRDLRDLDVLQNHAVAADGSDATGLRRQCRPRAERRGSCFAQLGSVGKSRAASLRRRDGDGFFQLHRAAARGAGYHVDRRLVGIDGQKAGQTKDRFSGGDPLGLHAKRSTNLLVQIPRIDRAAQVRSGRGVVHNSGLTLVGVDNGLDAGHRAAFVEVADRLHAIDSACGP